MIPKPNFDRYGPRARERYEALSEHEQHIVDVRFERHRAACEKSQMGPDPLFLFELLNEIEEGRIGV